MKPAPYATVTTAKRITTPAVYKDLPTLDEAGMKGFNVSIWHGLYAPKGTPAAVVKTLNDALKTALKDPEFIRRKRPWAPWWCTMRATIRPTTRSSWPPKSPNWGAVIKAAGQYAD